MSYPQRTLGELCNIVIGRTPSRSEPSYWGKGNKWVSISDLNGKVVSITREEITDYAVTSARCRRISKGTLLFSFKLTIGKMAFAGCDLFTNEAIAALEIKDGNILAQDYLYYALRSAKFGGSNQAAKGKTLNSKSLAEITIPLPLLDDQKRIAHLLDKVERLITHRKEHLQQLDDFLKSVFLQIFGDPIQNERSWELSPIEGLCEDIIDCPHSTPMYSDQETGYFCIRSGDIVNGHLDLSRTLQVDQSVFNERVKRHTPQISDIVYSREGGRLGNAARVLGREKICLGQRMMLFKVDEKHDSDFFWALLESVSFKRKLEGLVGGGAAPRVNIKDLKDIVVIKPSSDSRKEFSKIVTKADKIRLRYHESLADLKILYGSLSQMAVKGQLDLYRVPLLSEQDVLETKKHDETGISPIFLKGAAGPKFIQLPAPVNLMALASKKDRDTIISQWLDAYLIQIDIGEIFSSSEFLAAAQQRIEELLEDESPNFTLHAYEQIKAWIFQALANGRLTQAYDNEGNRVQLSPFKV